MINFFRKKEFFSIRCDLHSHLIPGIDDGSNTIDESLDLLRGLSELGYKRVITTPHVMIDAYNNSSKTILDGLEILRAAANDANIDIKIDAAAEYYLDEGFIPRLKTDDILTFNDNHLLFETSYVSRPLDIEDMIFQMKSNGYIPVFAHPERYRYMQNDISKFKQIKDLGVLFQCNINSFGGYYGQSAYKNAVMLAKAGMVDFVGSDLHSSKHLKFIKDVFEKREFNKLMKLNKLRN
jgi:tyrosine-protein phosphatase YwqE